MVSSLIFFSPFILLISLFNLPVYGNFFTSLRYGSFQVLSVMSTTGFAKAVNNLMIGLKFTILFQLPEPGQCVICRDSYGSSVGKGTVFRGGVHYEE